MSPLSDYAATVYAETAPDYRTTEEIAEDEHAADGDAREFLTGFPARPGTIR
jgi:hypothetical protein